MSDAEHDNSTAQTIEPRRITFRRRSGDRPLPKSGWELAGFVIGSLGDLAVPVIVFGLVAFGGYKFWQQSINQSNLIAQAKRETGESLQMAAGGWSAQKGGAPEKSTRELNQALFESTRC